MTCGCGNKPQEAQRGGVPRAVPVVRVAKRYTRPVATSRTSLPMPAPVSPGIATDSDPVGHEMLRAAGMPRRAAGTVKGCPDFAQPLAALLQEHESVVRPTLDVIDTATIAWTWATGGAGFVLTTLTVPYRFFLNGCDGKSVVRDKAKNLREACDKVLPIFNWCLETPGCSSIPMIGTARDIWRAIREMALAVEKGTAPSQKSQDDFRRAAGAKAKGAAVAVAADKQAWAVLDTYVLNTPSNSNTTAIQYGARILNAVAGGPFNTSAKNETAQRLLAAMGAHGAYGAQRWYNFLTDWVNAGRPSDFLQIWKLYAPHRPNAQTEVNANGLFTSKLAAYSARQKGTVPGAEQPGGEGAGLGELAIAALVAWKVLA